MLPSETALPAGGSNPRLTFDPINTPIEGLKLMLMYELHKDILFINIDEIVQC